MRMFTETSHEKLSADIGMMAQRKLNIDLVEHGPHALLTGTTGSGKSELLLTLLSGLASQYSPNEMSFILLDFKGGSSFGVLEVLPHTMVVETNLVAQHSLRSLNAIRTELHRREHLFQQVRVPDYVSYRKEFPHHVLPRLVVAIDELRILVDDDPEAANLLGRLAATGRSLGFHLVLATQRAQGAVAADIRANLGTILAMRTATEQDSWDVLSTRDAFRISPHDPGRGFIKIGSGTPQEFQAQRFAVDDQTCAVLSPQMAQREANSEADVMPWPAVAKNLATEASRLALPIPAPVLLPSLPEKYSYKEQNTRDLRDTSQSAPVILGLVDAPEVVEQYELTIDAEFTTDGYRKNVEGSVGWLGSDNGGWEDSYRSILSQYGLGAQKGAFYHLASTQQATTGYQGWHEAFFDDDVAAHSRTLLDQLEKSCFSASMTTLLIGNWDMWSSVTPEGAFATLEDRILQLLRKFPKQLRVLVFGSRVLASSRLIAMINSRIYLPWNCTPEQKMIWPKMITIPDIQNRGVLITSDTAAGHAIQVATNA